MELAEYAILFCLFMICENGGESSNTSEYVAGRNNYTNIERNKFLVSGHFSSHIRSKLNTLDVFTKPIRKTQHFARISHIPAFVPTTAFHQFNVNGTSVDSATETITNCRYAPNNVRLKQWRLLSIGLLSLFLVKSAFLTLLLLRQHLSDLVHDHEVIILVGTEKSNSQVSQIWSLTRNIF